MKVGKYAWLAITVGVCMLNQRSAYADGGPIGCVRVPERVDIVQLWQLEFQSATFNGAPVDTRRLPVLTFPPDTSPLNLADIQRELVLEPHPDKKGRLSSLKLSWGRPTLTLDAAQ